MNEEDKAIEDFLKNKTEKSCWDIAQTLRDFSKDPYVNVSLTDINICTRPFSDNSTDKINILHPEKNRLYLYIDDKEISFCWNENNATKQKKLTKENLGTTQINPVQLEKCPKTLKFLLQLFHAQYEKDTQEFKTLQLIDAIFKKYETILFDSKVMTNQNPVKSNFIDFLNHLVFFETKIAFFTKYAKPYILNLLASKKLPPIFLQTILINCFESLCINDNHIVQSFSSIQAILYYLQQNNQSYTNAQKYQINTPFLIALIKQGYFKKVPKLWDVIEPDCYPLNWTFLINIHHMLPTANTINLFFIEASYQNSNVSNFENQQILNLFYNKFQTQLENVPNEEKINFIKNSLQHLQTAMNPSPFDCILKLFHFFLQKNITDLFLTGLITNTDENYNFFQWILTTLKFIEIGNDGKKKAIGTSCILDSFGPAVLKKAIGTAENFHKFIITFSDLLDEKQTPRFFRLFDCPNDPLFSERENYGIFTNKFTFFLSIMKLPESISKIVQRFFQENEDFQYHCIQFLLDKSEINNEINYKEKIQTVCQHITAEHLGKKLHNQQYLSSLCYLLITPLAITCNPEDLLKQRIISQYSQHFIEYMNVKNTVALTIKIKIPFLFFYAFFNLYQKSDKKITVSLFSSKKYDEKITTCKAIQKILGDYLMAEASTNRLEECLKNLEELHITREKKEKFSGNFERLYETLFSFVTSYKSIAKTFEYIPKAFEF